MHHFSVLSSDPSQIVTLLFLQEGNLLLTVGSEEPGVSSSTLKIWGCNKLEALALSLGSVSAPASDASYLSGVGEARRGSSDGGANQVAPVLAAPVGALLRWTKVFSAPRWEDMPSYLTLFQHPRLYVSSWFFHVLTGFQKLRSLPLLPHLPHPPIALRGPGSLLRWA